MVEIPLKIRNALVNSLAQLDIWQTHAGRMSLLKEAGLGQLIPYLKLETTARIAASNVVDSLTQRGESCLMPFLRLLAEKYDTKI